MLIILVLIGVSLIVAIFMWTIYNGLVTAKNIVDEAYSGIDVQLKKRFELIPNLIEAVKGYNSHEADLLEQILKQRITEGDILKIADNDNSITNSLKQFRINVEAYPDLKANTQFLKLMDNLSIVENELAMSRRYFNGATRDYNIKIEVFPTVLVANKFGFKKNPLYVLRGAEETELPLIDLK
ncbi:MAG: LemA family protein [Crocinitomicaceae bacterium]|nr:LemA family protein [Crocinitomicaceae bacterium]